LVAQQSAILTLRVQLHKTLRLSTHAPRLRLPRNFSPQHMRRRCHVLLAHGHLPQLLAARAEHMLNHVQLSRNGLLHHAQHPTAYTSVTPQLDAAPAFRSQCA
jgi:hypothetical protein